MSDTIYRPFGRVLMRDDDSHPLAVSCQQCGRFALDTETGLCGHCNLMRATVLVLGRQLIQQLQEWSR